jgi:hypothetical protein
MADEHNRGPEDGKYDKQAQKIDETTTRLWLASDNDKGEFFSL